MRRDMTEIEYALCGAVLKDTRRVLRVVRPLLSAEDFSIDPCAALYAAAIQAQDKGQGFDEALAITALTEQMEYEAAGGFVALCMDSAPTTANAEAHAKLLHKAAVDRELRRAVENILADPNREDTAEALTAVCKAALERKIDAHPADLSSILTGYLNGLSAPQTRLHTGFADLDELIMGMGAGELVLVGARPAVGKSAFSLSLAEAAAKHGTVLLYSLEMSVDEVAERLQVRHTDRVTLSDLVNGQTQSEALWQELADAASELSALPIRICDAPNMTVARIRAQAMAQENLSCVIVDYVGLLRPDRRNDNRNLELGQISRDLKNLAAELRVPVIALAQLNRGRDETEQPTLRDLRDSGELEQNANKVLFLWKVDSGQQIIGCSVAKNRRGKTGAVQFKFEGAHMRFWPLCKGEYVTQGPVRSAAYQKIMGGGL